MAAKPLPIGWLLVSTTALTSTHDAERRWAVVSLYGLDDGKKSTTWHEKVENKLVAKKNLILVVRV